MFWSPLALKCLRRRIASVDYDTLARENRCGYEDIILAAARIILAECKYDPAELRGVADAFGVPEAVYNLASYELFALALKPYAFIRALAATPEMVTCLRRRMASSFAYKGIATDLMVVPGYTYQLYRESRMILAELDYIANWESGPHRGNLEHLMRTWRLEYKFKHVLAYRLSENSRAARAPLLAAFDITMPSMAVPECRGEAHLAYVASIGTKRSHEGSHEAKVPRVESEVSADAIIIRSLLDIIASQKQQISDQAALLEARK